MSKENKGILLRRNQTRAEFTLTDLAKAMELYLGKNVYKASGVSVTDVYGINERNMLELDITLYPLPDEA